METMSESKLKPTGGVEQVWGLAVAAHFLITSKAGEFQRNAGVRASHGTLVAGWGAPIVQFGDGNVTDELFPWVLLHFSPFLLSLLASRTSPCSFDMGHSGTVAFLAATLSGSRLVCG